MTTQRSEQRSLPQKCRTSSCMDTTKLGKTVKQKFKAATCFFYGSRSSSVPIPTGLCLEAQGCEERATLGKCDQHLPTPTGLRLSHGSCGHNPVGVVDTTGVVPRVARSSHPWALGRNPFGILPAPAGDFCYWGSAVARANHGQPSLEPCPLVSQFKSLALTPHRSDL